jgi:hypothetical protein
MKIVTHNSDLISQDPPLSISKHPSPLSTISISPFSSAISHDTTPSPENALFGASGMICGGTLSMWMRLAVLL